MPKSRKQNLSNDNATRLYTTADIPQANKLSNIRQLVAAVKDGITNPSPLLQLLDVDERHFAYYRQAAIILGVLRKRSDNSLKLTEKGSTLLSTAEGSKEERAYLYEIIISAPSLKAFTSFFDGENISLDELTHRMGVMTGLSHSTAIRRAQTLVQWRKYILGEGPQKNKGLEITPITDQLKTTIARHNALTKQKYLEWLYKIDPTEFEKLIGRLIREMGYIDIEEIGGPGDLGVDLFASLMHKWGRPIKTAIQVKRYSKPVGRKIVHEFIGAISQHKCSQALLITTSTFTQDAKDAAGSDSRIQLVNGAELVDHLIENGIGLRLGEMGEIIPSESL